jgi:hypothetical protein
MDRIWQVTDPKELSGRGCGRHMYTEQPGMYPWWYCGQSDNGIVYVGDCCVGKYDDINIQGDKH